MANEYFEQYLEFYIKGTSMPQPNKYMDEFNTLSDRTKEAVIAYGKEKGVIKD